MAKEVALLMGGWSSERSVSLDKGKAVEAALREAGYTVRVIDVKQDLADLLQQLTPRPDVVFNNLYGQGGEDGVIQGVLDMMNLPYTHSGVAASAIGMDKIQTKAVAKSVGVPVAEHILISVEEAAKGINFPRPYVVKPHNEGSSIGVTIVMENENYSGFSKEDWTFGDQVMVERFIPGKEIQVTVLNGKPQAVTEIVLQGRFFDYDAKYNNNSAQFILPAQLPKDVYDATMTYGERLYNALNCKGIMRCDFRYDDNKGGPESVYLLEVNTQPGFSPVSVAPSQVAYCGMDFVQLCKHLVENASCGGGKK